jgi:hypothetical protein
VVIRPQVGSVGSTDFQARHDAILEGEKAAQAASAADSRSTAQGGPELKPFD